MSVKKKTVLSLICNGIVLLVTTGIVISYFFVKSKLVRNGWESFIFFTTDSNVLAAIASVPVIVCDIKILRGMNATVARPFTLLKYAAVVSLLLTFFTVMCLLVPLYGAALELGRTGFHVHLTAPLLTFVSFVFFDPHGRLNMRDTLFGLLPTLLYGAVYFTEVVVLKSWWDFYAFNSGGRWYLVMPVIIGFSYLLCVLVRLVKNKVGDRRS